MEKSTFLSRIIPSSLIGRVVLFFFFPLVLLLSTAWAALLAPTALSPYICGLLLFGTVMSCKYRLKGFLTSLSALLAAYIFKHSGLHFFEIGLCLAAACDFLIILLVVDEVQSALAIVVDESKSHMNQYLAKNQELIETEESFSKTKQTLEEEIASWKEQAEQRKIDLQMAQEKMQLIQSEIDMLTEQKQSILEDAYRERKEAKHQLALIKEQMAEVERAREEVHRRLEATEEGEKLRQQLQQERQEVQLQISTVRQQYQERLESAEKEQQAIRLQLSDLQVEKADVENQKQQIEKVHQELRMQTDAQIADLQKQLELLKVQLEAAPVQAVESDKVHPDLAQLEGLYKQLRSQFEEKSRTLVQTRKELFSAQTKLQAIECQKELDCLCGPSEEVLLLEKALNSAVQECEELQLEVNSLEALISHILSQ